MKRLVSVLKQVHHGGMSAPYTLPRIWAVSYRSLSQLIDSLLPEYAAYADIRIIVHRADGSLLLAYVERPGRHVRPPAARLQPADREP